MSWAPDPTALGQLQHILGGTLSPKASERQQATDALEQARAQQDFNNYLVYVLVTEDSATLSQIRAASGLSLKNSIQKDFRIGENSYLLSVVLRGLVSADTLVRNITGTVITTLFAQLGVKGWPSVLGDLVVLCETGSTQTKEGASGALAKICEDSGHILNSEYDGTRPLDLMVPKFLELLENVDSSKVRANALSSLNHIIELRTQSFLVHMDAFLSHLFVLANDQDKAVHRNVCKSFIAILETRPDILAPHIEGVIQYILHSITNESDEEVQLEACEFLLTLASSNDVPSSIVEPHLPAIIPVILQSMVYSEMELFLLDTRDDADEEDREEDIRPQNAKSKSAHTAKSNRQAEDRDEDEDEDEDGYGTEWSLRKCAAATLDMLATSITAPVISITLPLLKEKITSELWPLREAAILAFGAIADGGISYTSEQLPELVPFLVSRLSDDEPAVRGITCWTLSRYSSWICSEAHTGGAYSGYFNPTFAAILHCAVEKKKTVQESACSAVAQFIDNADAELITPVASDLVDAFNICFGLYKKKNMVVLYDAIQTLIERVELEDDQLSRLLPALVNKWETLSDEDPELWGLMECFSSVAAGMGEKFAPFAVQVYQRATRVLAECIELDRRAVTDPSIHSREKDFIITALDLIDGLCQGLGSHSGELIDSTLLTILLETFNDEDDDVRQSAYALLGDLAIYLPQLLSSQVQGIVTALLQEVITRSYGSLPVCNNACWAFGEMALRMDLSAFCGKSIPVLIDVLNSDGLMDTVLENAAISLGRLGIRHSEFLAPYLAEFTAQWAANLLYCEENEEKETSCQGMCNAVMTDPEALLRIGEGKVLVAFVDVISTYATPGQVLAETFQKLLQGYKQVLGSQWGAFLNRVSGGEDLVLRYGV